MTWSYCSRYSSSSPTECISKHSAKYSLQSLNNWKGKRTRDATINLFFLETHNGIFSCQFDCANITVKQSNQQKYKCPLKQRGKNKTGSDIENRESYLFSCLILRLQNQKVYLKACANLNKNILIYIVYFRVKRCQPLLQHALKELNLVWRQKIYKKRIPWNYHIGDKTRLSLTVSFHFIGISITNI